MRTATGRDTLLDLATGRDTLLDLVTGVCVSLSFSLTRCRRVQLAVSRALFHLQDLTGSGLTRDHQQKVDVLSHFLLHGREVPRKASRPVQRE